MPFHWKHFDINGIHEFYVDFRDHIDIDKLFNVSEWDNPKIFGILKRVVHFGRISS